MTSPAETTVDVELAPALHQPAARSDPGLLGCRTAVQKALEDLVDRLGVGVGITVNIGCAPDALELFTVTAGGARCDTDDSASSSLFRGVAGIPWYRQAGEAEAVLAGRARSGDVAGFSTVLSAVVTEAVGRNAIALVDRDHLASILSEGAPPPGAVAGLELALRLGLSLRDAHDRYHQAVDPGLPAAGIAEQVVDSLASGTWRIKIHPGYLEALLESADVAAPDGFAAARKGLYTELGVALPDLTVVEDPALPEFGFAFDLGGADPPPFIGLPPDAVLAISTTGDDPRVVEPLTGIGAAVIPAAQATSEATGAITPVGLMARAFRYAIADRLPSTITLSSTRSQVDLLQYLAPRLTEAIRPHLVALTRRRRAMVSAGTSVRDLAAIAQTILDESVRPAPQPAGASRAGAARESERAGAADPSPGR
ncbi:FHIPEP family type III secretion protein [Amycolatopsis sp. cg9]|uniref:FHIPEP family type III secretion protein n=1 Tax=Amycolatopsis sp. cg9 TaxID=3238801 RepID=UPI0035268CE8